MNFLQVDDYFVESNFLIYCCLVVFITKPVVFDFDFLEECIFSHSQTIEVLSWSCFVCIVSNQINVWDHYCIIFGWNIEHLNYSRLATKKKKIMQEYEQYLESKYIQ